MDKKSPTRTKQHAIQCPLDAEEFAEFLGPLAKSYTKAQLQQLREDMVLMAELLLDFYLTRKERGTQRGNEGSATFDN
jgi:hypothetical protein